jgi:hypothetical protein
MIYVTPYIRTDSGFIPVSHVANDQREQARNNALSRAKTYSTLTLDGDLSFEDISLGRAPDQTEFVRFATHRSNAGVVPVGTRLLTIDPHTLNWTTAPIEERPPGQEVIAARLTQPMATDGTLRQRMKLPDEPPSTRNRFAGELELDYGTGYLFGVMVSEAWTDTGTRRNYVHIASVVTPIVEAVKDVVRRYAVNGVTFTKTENEHAFDGHAAYSEKWTFSSYRLAKFFREHFGRTSGVKRLPDWALQARAEFRWGLFTGLIDGDGGVSISRPKAKRGNKRSAQVTVKFDTSSEQLAAGVMRLAYSLGLHPSLRTYTAKSGTLMYCADLDQASIAAVKRAVDLKHPDKAAKLAQHTTGAARRRGVYAPPLPRYRLKELRRAVWGVKLAREAGWDDAYSRARRRLYNNVGDALRKPDPERGRRGLPMLLQDTAEAILAEAAEFFDDPYWARWRQLTLDERFTWEVLESAEPVDAGDQVAVTMSAPRDKAAGGETPVIFTATGFGVALTQTIE